MTTADKLAYLTAEDQASTETLLAKALATGVDALYREARLVAYVEGRCSRDEAVRDLGLEAVTEVDLQEDAFRRDIDWGLNG